MSFRVLADADSESIDAAVWLNSRRAGLGQEFLLELESALEQIEAQPRLYSPTPDGPTDVETREYLIRQFSYRIIYTISDVEIVVVAITHTSRKPGWWKRRVAK